MKFEEMAGREYVSISNRDVFKVVVLVRARGIHVPGEPTGLVFRTYPQSPDLDVYVTYDPEPRAAGAQYEMVGKWEGNQ